MKKMKPVLFNTDMVRAILEDRKTATRRAIKPQPDKVHIYPLGFCVDGHKKDIGKFGFGTREHGGNIFYVKPPCRIGDILYVRETWCKHPKLDKYYYRADGLCSGKSTEWGCPAYNRMSYCDLCEWMDGYIRWHPSIHMPKEAARVFLKVTDVRVERLQDITETQAIQEGTPYELCGGWKPTYNDPDSGGPDPDFINGFARLWDSTIKKADMDRYGWEADPWVWVTEFKRIDEAEIKEGIQCG